MTQKITREAAIDRVFEWAINPPEKWMAGVASRCMATRDDVAKLVSQQSIDEYNEFLDNDSPGVEWTVDELLDLYAEGVFMS